jgi:hypothetical protein
MSGFAHRSLVVAGLAADALQAEGLGVGIRPAPREAGCSPGWLLTASLAVRHGGKFATSTHFEFVREVDADGATLDAPGLAVGVAARLRDRVRSAVEDQLAR